MNVKKFNNAQRMDKVYIKDLLLNSYRVKSTVYGNELQVQKFINKYSGFVKVPSLSP